MRQVVQSVRSGDLRLVSVPTPVIGPTEVLVRVHRSVVSAGTERAVRNLAKASLVGKARARPDLVRQVIRRAKDDGVLATMRAVRTRLEDDMPLGYSAVGTAVEVGEYVTWIRPGMRVATAGAGHAEFQVVAGNLCSPVPDGVDDLSAAFTTVAAIALHGIRQADVQVGGRIAVVGLGLVGRLTVRLARAAGLEVVGLDVSEWPVQQVVAEGHAAFADNGADTTRAVLDWSRGHGVDAVVITAAAPTSEPTRRAVELLRDRGTIVIVGDVGLELERTPLYEKEVTVRLARSYGPGRYERAYEEWGVDLPIGQVRWTEGRNLESVLGLLASGSVTFDDLVTHRFPLDQVVTAYEAIEGTHGPFVGVQLEYPSDLPVDRSPVTVGAPRSRPGAIGVGLLGAGNFARATLLPALRPLSDVAMVSVASAGGTSARHLAERHGFSRVATDASTVIGDPEVDLVIVATPHSTHAAQVIEALGAGKHVFCEKPLAITVEDLDRVEAAWRARQGSSLLVGFNRRFSPAVERVRQVLGSSGGPLVMSYRVNAGELPESHWYHSRTEGGRMLGEACHFVDTCAAITGAAPVEVTMAADHRSEPVLAEDFILAARFADGSTASVAYASGGWSGGPKERLEIMGRGHTVEIDDFRRVIVDGESVLDSSQDKGHRAQFAALIDHVRGRADLSDVTEVQLAVSRGMLEALASVTRASNPA